MNSSVCLLSIAVQSPVYNTAYSCVCPAAMHLVNPYSFVCFFLPLFQQIDGEAFLLMTQTDIVKIMSIKLGPALKIFNSILMFKAAEKNSHNEL